MTQQTLTASPGGRISTEPPLLVDPSAAGLITPYVARHLRAIPLTFRDGALVVAVEDEAPENAANGVATLTGHAVVAVPATRTQVRRAQDRFYGRREARFTREDDVRPRLGEMLLDRGQISATGLSEALDVHEHSGRRLGELLISIGGADEADVMRALAEQLGLQFVETVSPARGQASLMPAEMVRRLRVVPLAGNATTVWVATAEPADTDAIAEVEAWTGKTAIVRLATATAIKEASDRLYQQGSAERESRRRARPFDSVAKSFRAGLLSLLAMALIAGYLFVPSLAPALHGGIELGAWVGVAFKVLAILTLVVGAYYSALYVTAVLRPTRAPQVPAGTNGPLFAVVIPAHNEELVIGQTVKRLRDLHYDRFVVMVMNDGSSDRTSEVAMQAAQGDHRIVVVDRDKEIAGQGKGEVLNDAYRRLCKMAEQRAPILGGATSDDIVVCVLDADGWLRRGSLTSVAPYFADDPKVAGVQIPVRMYNASNGILARMQDVEFTGVSFLIQGARDRIGSVGLGGNGQFVRLRALKDLGRSPWTKNLTEDLDLGLLLVEKGWRNRFCPDTWVSQQAVTDVKRLLKQRTRWVQGHMSCWYHLPRLWSAPGIPLRMRLDLSLHLLLCPMILLVTVQGLIGAGGYLGLFPLDTAVIPLVGGGWAYRIAVIVFSLIPLSVLCVTYQRSLVTYRHSQLVRLPLWSLPAMGLSFVAYSFLWGVPGCLKAPVRLLLGRNGWAKTARDVITEADLIPEGASA